MATFFIFQYIDLIIQKKRGQFTVYAPEVSANTLLSYTSKSPRELHVSIGFTLDSFFLIADFQKQDHKANASIQYVRPPFRLCRNPNGRCKDNAFL